MKRIVAAALAGGVVLGVTGCSSDEPDALAAAPAATSAPSASAATEEATAAALKLSSTTVRTMPGTAAAPFDTKRELDAPPGWTVTVWARVEGARLLAWTPDDRLLVSRPKSGDVVMLTPGTSTAAPAQKTLVSGLTQPHGLAFAGDTLYLAESDQVDGFTYANGALSGERVVADGLPDEKSPELGGAYAHALKSVAVGKDGAVYVSIGSTGNVSEEDRDGTPERASILRVPPGGGAPETYARGVRNGTGLAIDPDGAVWTAVNHRDNVAYPHDDDYDGDGTSDQGKVMQEYVNDHPMEQLAKLTPGRELGWPYCNPDPDLKAGKLAYSNRPFVRDLQMNADGSQLDCAKLAPTEQGFGAHSAPLGLSFGEAGGYGPGAFAGVHGSWNREPPRPPEVSFFAWRDGTLGEQQTLLTGFQGADGSRWGRPVMAVQGPDGALYVSDDYAGAIYRVAKA
ncbi:glucose/arabinose dehydrogenase [Actinoplanes lutulentus]|uniref:Glucose/arabinose dehydrogenase n=1 Tax=Actinoplanes lutulentus TaxID=1287878 RepID=A0A327ZKW3_9ACTN|nr:gluconolaconase [Actinoplanes lutulentus]MBB2940719.1 glucose/arabinose dehydrogenase [Actinoplanes lutulentus]RAK43030.1 glucose/arabinose dehydrogenase [Actinoplanes lutulentus]